MCAVRKMSLLGSIFFALFHVALGEYQYEEPLLYDTFPDGFAWGVATSAYQVIFLNTLLISCSKRIPIAMLRSREAGTLVARE